MAKRKPTLLVKTKAFVEWVFDTTDGSEGYNLNKDRAVEKSLIKTGKFSMKLSDFSPGYIPKKAIANIREVPKEFWTGVNKDEVEPNNFRIVFVK